MILCGRIRIMMKFKRFLKDVVIIFFLTIIFGMIILFWEDKKDTEEVAQNDVQFAELKTICDLATIKSFYHNVADYEEEASGLFGFMGVGYKKFWMEYTGVIEAGIDFSEVRLDSSDETGIIKVYVPDAQIINADVENTSISTTAQETGIFTDVTLEDESDALWHAQVEMKENAMQNKALLNQAKERAKQLIKEYIVNQGKLLGKEYHIVWEEE